MFLLRALGHYNLAESYVLNLVCRLLGCAKVNSKVLT